MISDDMSGYFSDKDEIASLKKKIRLLIKNNSKWKRAYEDAKSDKPSIRRQRTNKAEALVRAWIGGDKSMNFRAIAEKCFLSRETIKNISYKLRHNK